MSEVIDYQAVAEGLQRELEQARLEILRLRFSRESFKIDGKAINTFLKENYLAIAALGLVLSIAFSMIDFIKSLKGEKHEG